jgi:hypothetical protein
MKLILLLVFCVGFIAIAVYLTTWAIEAQCINRWSALGLEPRFRPFSGCFVKTKDGRWSHEDRIVFLVDPK